MSCLRACLAVVSMICLAAIGRTAEGSVTLPMDVDAAKAAGWLVAGEPLASTTDAAGRAAISTTTEIAPERKTRPATITWPTAIASPVVLEAIVRLPTVLSQTAKGSQASAALIWTVTPAEGEPVICRLDLSRMRARNDETYTAIMRSPSGGSTSRTYQPLYTMASISPLMDEHERLILEQRIGDLKPIHERLMRLRMELRPGSLRAYVDGRMVSEESGDFTSSGSLSVDLRNNAQVYALSATPLAGLATGEQFVTVPLDGFLNAKGPGQTPGLAAAGQTTVIEGVPFMTSARDTGEDHLDLEPSIYLHRMGIFRQGDSRESVTVPESMDVTRFTMRVPQRTYRRAWVLAAADGEANNAPVLTLRFYRPRTPWTVDATVTAPSYTATTAPGAAVRLPWTGAGEVKSLWLIPIELDAAALAVESMDCIELTKAILPYRGWPDPAYYNNYPGGLPSGVHVYALTLEEAPVWARGTGAKNANLYEPGETPSWRVLMRNLSTTPQSATVDITVTGPYGETSTHSQTVALPVSAAEQVATFEPPTPVYGLYTVQTTVTAGDFRQSREGTFLKLAPGARRATGADSPWGLWCWNGGHDTNPDPQDNMRILRALGAINNFQHSYQPNRKEPAISLYPMRQEMGIGSMHHRLVPRRLPAWADKDPYDPAEFAAYAEEKGLEAAALLAEHPDLQYVNFFAENNISLRLTHGMSPWAMGQPYFEYDETEARRLRQHWVVAQAALQGVRKHAPQLKVIFGHGAGNFVQPFFRLEDWDNDMFAGFGMDLPQFERMPERQPRATEPSLLWFLHHQMEEKGILGKEIVHLESYFPSSGPMALTFQEQAESVTRTAALSLALGTTRFMRTWELHTSGDGWGGSHYGSCGLIDRSPEFNPKPAAEAFATMTRVLDMAKYDGYLDVGSRSAYCLRFADTDRTVYAVWTVRGERPLALTADPGTAIERVDQHGNTFPVALADGAGTVTLSSTLQWLVARGGRISAATVGSPSYQAAPAPISRVVDHLATGWTYDAGSYERYQTNHWDMPREPGSMTFAHVANPGRDRAVMRVELTAPDQTKPMVGFYGLFQPAAPISIPGSASALGIWVNGQSAWNRFIYEIVDAKGETWLSCGNKDAWNCDDIYSWSSANHDGWRYLRFPLPGNAPGDHYRLPDTTWWGNDGDGIVDLPLTINRLIVEMRPQMIYVNDMLPVTSTVLEFADLTVEYASESDQTDAPIRLQTAAAGVLSHGDLNPMPNPHVRLLAGGVGAAPTILAVYPPEQGNNGQRLYVDVSPVPGATQYRGYVSAYPDGRGAQPLAQDKTGKSSMAKSLEKPNTLFFDRLRADKPMYLFVTVLDADGQESKPSPIREVILKDEFPFK